MLRQLRQKLVNWLLKNARIGHLEVGEHTVTIDGNNITVPGTVDGVDISVHAANADAHHARSHDHSLAADGSPIAVAGVPSLDAAKITSGRFGVARMPDGISGQVLTSQGAGNSPAYSDTPTLHILINEQTGASYTLVLSDDGKLIDMNSATAQTLTVPVNASVAFPVGTQILVRQKGAGQVTIAGAAGVTLVAADNALKTRVQHSTAGLIKVATDTWVVFGDTAV